MQIYLSRTSGKRVSVKTKNPELGSWSFEIWVSYSVQHKIISIRAFYICDSVFFLAVFLVLLKNILEKVLCQEDLDLVGCVLPQNKYNYLMNTSKYQELFLRVHFVTFEGEEFTIETKSGVNIITGMFIVILSSSFREGCRGLNLTVVGFTTTYAISAYHH